MREGNRQKVTAGNGDAADESNLQWMKTGLIIITIIIVQCHNCDVFYISVADAVW